MNAPVSQSVPADRGHVPLASGEPDELSIVLEVLGDRTSRKLLWLLGRVDEPMTASEISEAGDASLTSVYRKLDGLTEAGLVVEHAEVDPDGHRRSRYRQAVDQVEIGLGADDGVAVTLYHAATRLRLAQG